MEEPGYETTPTYLEAIKTLMQLGGLAAAVCCGLASAKITKLDVNINSSLGIILPKSGHVGVN